MRASIYNAMPIEGVQALVAYMKDFERSGWLTRAGIALEYAFESMYDSCILRRSREPSWKPPSPSAARSRCPRPFATRSGLTKGTQLKVELDGSRIILRKNVDDALSRLRGRFKLPPGVSTDDVMRELRGRAPGRSRRRPADRRARE